MAVLNSKQKERKCKVRFEWILWVTVAMMAAMLVSVNLMLLDMQQPSKGPNKFPSRKRDATLITLPKYRHKSTPTREAANQGNASHNDDGDPILRILKYARVKNTPELRKKLPTWKQVVDRFGSEAKVVGLDTCEAYRTSVPPEKRAVAPAGPFNSGTNLLHEVLAKNCVIPGTKPDVTGILWQVNWGKHQPPRFRMQNFVRKTLNNTAYMPIVPLRDPYSWMQSMCNNMYAARWDHDGKHCPNIVPSQQELRMYSQKKAQMRSELEKVGLKLDNDTIPVRVDYKSASIHHQSLAHMWQDWYQEYYDATFPRLMVRLEDIVFHPGQVLRQICDCVGGNFAEELHLQGSSPKVGEGHGANPTGLSAAMIKHVFSNRTKGMTAEDMQQASRILDGSLMDLFGYSHPV